MPALPYLDDAFLDIRKLMDYCLSPKHPRGRHKARVFRDALDVGPKDADWLRSTLLDGIRGNEAITLSSDELGGRWRVDIPITRHGKQAMVRTIWIVRSGESFPRFVTCWVL